MITQFLKLKGTNGAAIAKMSIELCNDDDKHNTEGNPKEKKVFFI